MEMVFCYQNCSDILWEKIVLQIKIFFWKFEAKGPEFTKKKRPLEEFIQTDKGQKKFASRTLFNLLFEVPIWYYIIYVKVGFFA